MSAPPHSGRRSCEGGKRALASLNENESRVTTALVVDASPDLQTSVEEAALCGLDLIEVGPDETLGRFLGRVPPSMAEGGGMILQGS